jgi:hypothetical protein
MVLPLRVTVSPEHAEAAPGESLTLTVTVRNASDIVEHYGVEVLGLPDGATARANPDVTKLRPGESGTVTVQLTIPDKPPAAAGDYVLGVLARSRYRDDVSRCVELPLAVAAVENLTVRVTPEVVHGGRYGRYDVEVANDGNGPVRLRLAATDPERRVTVAFEPPTVDVWPGAVAQAVLNVHAGVPWSKEKQRRLTVEARGGDPGTVRAGGTATFVQRPRFASKLARFGGLAAAVALVAGAVVVGAVILKPDDPAESAGPGVTAGPSGNVTVPAGPPASAGQPSGPPSTEPSAAESPDTPPASDPPPQEVDFAAVADGPVGSDAFRSQGFIVGTDPGSIIVPGCEAATPAVVTRDDVRFLTASLPDDPTRCHEIPLLINFVDGAPAGSVEVVPVTPDTLEMEVVHRNLNRGTEKDLKADADPAKLGIVSVLIKPLSGPTPAAVPVEIRAIRLTPAA